MSIKKLKMVKAQLAKYEQVEFQGKQFLLPPPVKIPKIAFVERLDVIEQALAAWLSIDGMDRHNFRLYGPPGVGKNAIIYHLAEILGKDIYILNGHEELDPEDIACSATMSKTGEINYVASPLFAAMLKGGIFFFDEIGKAPPGAMNPLASVLDERRSLDSVLAGIHIEAHEEFLFCAALNEDEERAGRLPEFLDERLTPAIYVGFPERSILKKILSNRLPSCNISWIDIFLEECEKNDISPREGYKKLSFAFKLASAKKLKNPPKREIRRYIRLAIGKSEPVQNMEEVKSQKPVRKKGKKVAKQSNLSFQPKLENENIH